MSSRQKSFFDEIHGKKNFHSRGSWHNHSGNYGHRNQPEPTEAPPQPAKAPIAPSTRAKAILQSFTLPEETLKTPRRSPGKENVLQPSPTRKTVPRLVNSVSEPPAMVPPSTPAVRLPLSDLLGISDDGPRRCHEKEASPEDHVGWAPSNSQRDRTPAHVRKRAHSSSPAMTIGQSETSAHFGGGKRTDGVDSQTMLRTPKADPAADLWLKYNGPDPVDAAIGHKMQSLMHLLKETSPKSVPRTPGDSVNGLRRWASCGTEFPASRRKRRRIDVATGDSRLDSARTNTSRLGEMVDLLQANMVQQPKHELGHREPSSSSPLPDKGSFERQDHHSPLRKPTQCKTDACEALGISLPATNAQAAPLARDISSQSSDYGDDDVDLIDLIVNPPDDKSPDPHDDHTGSAAAADTLMHDSGHTGGARQPLQTIEEDSDEFGADDGLTAEDIDIAFTQKFQTGSTISQKTDQPRATGGATREPLARHLSKPIVLSDDEDEFGGDEVDDAQFAAAEVAATQSMRASSTIQRTKRIMKSRKIQRYLVQSVVSGTYRNDRNLQQEEKVLSVVEEKTRAARAITLRQSWLDTHCRPGAYVHVVGQFSRTGQITIDDAENLLIVHPDHLVSATTVADSFDCLRKAVLQDRVKATNVTSKATVYGSILHELFQIAMQHNRWDFEWLQELIHDLTIKYVEGLFEAGAKDLNEATEWLTSKMSELSSWANRFVRKEPDDSIKVQDRNGRTINMSITKLLDVEEHVWSPTYGLKGNIDATVEILMDDDKGRRRLTVPFEVKTGKYQSAAHRAQTALYTLLLSDRYDVDVQYGVLYYMENSAVTRIPAIRNELRHMVMQRNELASYVRERLSLPPMLKNEFKCGRCYAKTSCFLYHKLVEDGTPETAGVGSKFAQVVGKLNPIHQDFFKKWDDLLTKEETVMFRFKRELWTMLSHEREKLGRCFAEVIIEPGTAHEDHDAQKINRFTYTLVKKDAPPGFSFTESQITTGEPIVISSEQGHFALANGYVTKISANRIGVAVDRRLHNARMKQRGFDEDTNQCFAAIMEVGNEVIRSSARNQEQPGHQVVYRLDKDEFSNGMATVRNNIISIMNDDVFRSYELRELIIQNKPPIFKPAPSAYTLTGPASQMQINAGQKAAIDKIMSAQDYALVLGMPGTGKTTTIAHIIRALVVRGKSVLLTSYTHTAVDNILLKLRDASISVLRLGVQAKVHPEVQEFANLAAIPRQSIEELEEMYMTPQVVATTCLGVNHQIFHKRVFDYCIVDEASQITLPVCLGPIRMARTFVLVGDHYQLPPLVQNKEAQEGGLDVSLFKLLSDRQPTSVVDLDHQYRMCAEIMHLSNTLIYSGRLRCGSTAVAQRTLQIPRPSGLDTIHQQQATNSILLGESNVRPCTSPTLPSCLLSRLLDPTLKVIFADTDRLQNASETLSGSRITNLYEAQTIHLLSRGLHAQGLSPDQVGIITFYRSQLALLRQTLKSTPVENVEMHTADKFQGRDKEVVLLSCVRSNADGNVGELLRDWRRVNVAITRARSKFILVGSRRTLRADELWKKLIDVIDEMGGVVTLDESLLGGHALGPGTPSLLGKGSASWGETARASNGVRRGSADAPVRQGVLNPSRSAENCGKGLKRPFKQGRIGKDVMLRKSPISQNIVEILSQ